LLGIPYMAGVANGFKNVYFAGVLPRIAVAYFFAALIFCFLSSSSSGGVRPSSGAATSETPDASRGPNAPSPMEPAAPEDGRTPLDTPLGQRRRHRLNLFTLIAICLFLLIGYWALMTFVPVPGIGAPTLAEPGKTLAHYIDQLYMHGKK